MLDIIGWIGAFCFAVCGLPQAYAAYKKGNSEGVSLPFLVLWGLGEILTLIYMLPKQDYPVIFNLLVNLFFILVIMRYKLWPSLKLKNKI